MFPEPPAFSVRTVDADEVCTVELAGEIDLAASTSVNLAFEVILDRGRLPAVVHVDLLGVTFMDSLGISILLSARRRATTAGCRFAVTSSSPVIVRLLEVTGLTALLTGEGDVP